MQKSTNLLECNNNKKKINQCFHKMKHGIFMKLVFGIVENKNKWHFYQ